MREKIEEIILELNEKECEKILEIIMIKLINIIDDTKK